MGAIVYLSDFAPMKDPVFSLRWTPPSSSGSASSSTSCAMRALPAERIDQMIGEVVLPEEGELEGSAEEPLTRER